MDKINDTDQNNENQNKDIEVISGNGENLKISPVYDHIKIDKPAVNTNKSKKIVVPKTKKK